MPDFVGIIKKAMDREEFKSGFIAIIGRPNTGKSTLLNALLGEKVAIVSPKPQTTRNRIRGIMNTEGAQIIFIDTPGMHRSDKPLNAFMVKEALAAIPDVDGILFMVDATEAVDEDERFITESLEGVKAPVVLVINKIDAIGKGELLPVIETYSRLMEFSDVMPVSALKGENLNELTSVLKGLLPEGPEYFPTDILTDSPERFLVSEIIREKVFRLTHQEVPYSVAVVVEEFKERKGKNLIAIKAAINVEKDSQKGIVIGKKGAMLKKIGIAARTEIERLLGVKIFLELFVRVSKDWTKKLGALKEFGYK